MGGPWGGTMWGTMGGNYGDPMGARGHGEPRPQGAEREAAPPLYLFHLHSYPIFLNVNQLHWPVVLLYL